MRDRGRPPGASRLSGSVFFERGARDSLRNGPDIPVANWLVRLSPVGSDAVLFEALSGEGGYAFEGVTPGAYDVQLFAAGGPEPAARSSSKTR